MKITVISAGVRAPESSTSLLADRLTAAVEGALRERGQQADVTRIEVRDHAHAVVDATLTGFPTGPLADALAAIPAADALLLVTPTFQASYAGLFKSFMDLVEAGSLRGMPVLVAATGGTERHSLVLDHALRPLVAYLGGVAVPTGVYAATWDFASTTLDSRLQRAASELATLVSGASVRAPKIDEFAAPAPFEEMLRRVGQTGFDS